MSKNETPMTRWYWHQVGGTSIEEFKAVARGNDCGQRLIDGIIIKGNKNEIAHWSAVDIEGKGIVVIQTKAKRLGMYLMGQTLFSAHLMERFKPKSIEAVALCSKDDSALRPMLEDYPGMKVVICPPLDTLG